MLFDHQIYCLPACTCALFSPEKFQAAAVSGLTFSVILSLQVTLYRSHFAGHTLQVTLCSFRSWQHQSRLLGELQPDVLPLMPDKRKSHFKRNSRAKKCMQASFGCTTIICTKDNFSCGFVLFVCC